MLNIGKEWEKNWKHYYAVTFIFQEKLNNALYNGTIADLTRLLFFYKDMFAATAFCSNHKLNMGS